jgi:hypothetical protein
LDTTSDAESSVSSSDTYASHKNYYKQEAFKEVKQRKKQKQSKGRQTQYQRTQDLENSFLSITSALHDIAERLSKLEMRERKGKGVSRS